MATGEVQRKYMYESFIDLDELIVRCRDKSSRNFIKEAVSCYRAGAFRSCIVATWNAVVFDFLHKLRELELFGDREAAKMLEEFDELRSSGKKFKELWQFESNIPENALTKFELISIVEKSDIERLFEDRSRCAHPSMTSLEEPFEATGELARYHLRSAVTHLLERPPVQGRAAKTRIFEDIKSEYFPVNRESAIKYFQKGSLARARPLLIKDIVIGLTKSLLIEERPEDERARQFSALKAISSIYFQETREILNSKLSNIILERVKDENWDKAIIYLGSITAWDYLTEPCRLKAETYIDKLEIVETVKGHYYVSKQLSEEVIHILIKASHIDFLREAIIKKFRIPLKYLLSLKETCRDKVFKEKILIPVLRGLSSEATLDELLSMRSETLLRSDEEIKTYTKEKIKACSLKTLTSTASKYQQDEWLFDLIESELEAKIPTASLEDLLATKSTYKSIDETKEATVKLFNNSINQKVNENIETIPLEEIVLLMTRYQDQFFIDLIEPELENKISTAKLNELLTAKSKYKSIDEPKTELLKLFDNSITEKAKIASLDDLLNEPTNPNRGYFDNIHELINDNHKMLEPFFKNNVLAIIYAFERSNSWASAEDNAKLLVKITEYLNLEPKQWEKILEAFLANDQIYGRRGHCDDYFELLFKKSFELTNSVQPYWVSLRDNLNTLGRNSYLKKLIDFYIEKSDNFENH